MQKLRLFPLVLVLLHPLASSAAEQTNAAPARSTTLQECFDLALKYNLDLQIERINPRLSLIDITRYNILVAKNRIKYSDLHLRQQIISILTAVEQAYYELIFDFENVKVTEKGLQLAERLLAENKKRVEIGTLARLDEKQAESQAAARQTDLITAMATLNTQENLLKTLITARYRVLHDTRLQPREPLIALPTLLHLP